MVAVCRLPFDLVDSMTIKLVALVAGLAAYVQYRSLRIPCSTCISVSNGAVMACSSVELSVLLEKQLIAVHRGWRAANFRLAPTPAFVSLVTSYLAWTNLLII